MAFFGLYGSTAALATTLTLSAVVSAVGIGFQRGTHANWQLVTNDGTGAPTLTDMGAPFAIALGGVLTWLLCHTQRLVQSLCALLLLGLAQLAAAQWPLVAADDDQRGLFRWAYHLTNLNALSEFANHLWPWAALACLLLSISRQLRRERW